MMEEDGDWLPAPVAAPISPNGHSGRVPVPVFRSRPGWGPLPEGESRR